MKVMISGGFRNTFRRMIPHLDLDEERLELIYGGSIGPRPPAIPGRLLDGEHADLVVLAKEGMAELVRRDFVAESSVVDLAYSEIAFGVPESTTRDPDLHSVEAVAAVLTEVSSIGTSGSLPLIYLNELFERFDLDDTVRQRLVIQPLQDLLPRVAAGEIELCVQTVSELRGVPGVRCLGSLPTEIRRVSSFSAAPCRNSPLLGKVESLLQTLLDPSFHGLLEEDGLRPCGDNP
jgi:molybdate transport system substrate-binding protein